MNTTTPPASKEGTPTVHRFTLASWLSIYGRENYNEFVKESDYRALELENQSLQRRVGELEGDKARLDWLEEAGRKNSRHERDGDWYVCFSRWNESLRSAIDAARATLHQGDKA